MHYPPEFSNKARAAVEAEVILAERLHDDRRGKWQSDWSFPERESLTKCILSIFLVYARKTIELGSSGVWPVDQVREKAMEGLRLITIDVGYKKGYDSFLQSGSGYIEARAKREFEGTPEWRQFEDELLALAIQQTSESSPGGTSAESTVRFEAMDAAPKERTTPMVVFGSSHQVTLVRAAGTAQELRRDVLMGGDYQAKALFQANDRVVTGDQIICDLFDVPRIVSRVKPFVVGGRVAYWEAEMVPRHDPIHVGIDLRGLTAEIPTQIRPLENEVPRAELDAIPRGRDAGSSENLPSAEHQPAVEPEKSRLSGSADEISTRQRTNETDSTTQRSPDVADDTPEDRLSRFKHEHPSTTHADIKYSADVHSAELQDWRKSNLKPTSVMSRRIEDVLENPKDGDGDSSPSTQWTPAELTAKQPYEPLQLQAAAAGSEGEGDSPLAGKTGHALRSHLEQAAAGAGDDAATAKAPRLSTFDNPIRRTKVKLLRKQMSPEETLRELRLIADDEGFTVELRASILDELNRLAGASPDAASGALREALGQKSEEIRRDAVHKILDRILAPPAIKDYEASKRHTGRLRDLEKRSRGQTEKAPGVNRADPKEANESESSVPSEVESTPAAGAAKARRASHAHPHKGDVTLLQRSDGSRYQSVDFPTAEKYAGISTRRRQQLVKDQSLQTTGKGQNRRVSVESLIAYCPPQQDAK